MKLFTMISAVIFAVMAVAHVLRLIFGWVVMVDGITVPIWVSAAAALITAGLSLMLFLEARRQSDRNATH